MEFLFSQLSNYNNNKKKKHLGENIHWDIKGQVHLEKEPLKFQLKS